MQMSPPNAAAASVRPMRSVSGCYRKITPPSLPADLPTHRRKAVSGKPGRRAGANRTALEALVD